MHTKKASNKMSTKKPVIFVIVTEEIKQPDVKKLFSFSSFDQCKVRSIIWWLSQTGKIIKVMQMTTQLPALEEQSIAERDEKMGFSQLEMVLKEKTLHSLTFFLAKPWPKKRRWNKNMFSSFIINDHSPFWVFNGGIGFYNDHQIFASFLCLHGWLIGYSWTRWPICLKRSCLIG